MILDLFLTSDPQEMAEVMGPPGEDGAPANGSAQSRQSSGRVLQRSFRAPQGVSQVCFRIFEGSLPGDFEEPPWA